MVAYAVRNGGNVKPILDLIEQSGPHFLFPQLEVNSFIRRLNVSFVRTDAAIYVAVFSPQYCSMSHINKYF